MTVNYFLKCPVCGSITRMRTPAGYIYKTPVRIHCGNCDTLMTGEFISDDKKPMAKYVPFNCEEIDAEAYDYFGEASGELLCHKIIQIHAEGKDIYKPPRGWMSPVFAFLDSTTEEDRARFVDYSCYTYTLSEKWDKERIKYDLYLKGKNQLLIENYSEDAKKYGCQLYNDQDVRTYIYRALFHDLGGFFKKKELLQLFRSINHHISHIKTESIDEYLAILRSTNRLETVQGKIFNVVCDFRDVANNLVPALGMLYRKNEDEIDKSLMGISTCSFEDIKYFYQNTFEVLVDCCDLIVGLDNIENRGDCNRFNNGLDLKKFREQAKGNRIKELKETEFFAKTFALPVASSSLRNAIGHSDYRYVGVKQEISYPEKTGSDVIFTSYLLDVALECCNMVRSAYVLTIVVGELLRYEQREVGSPMPMHPLMYKGIKTQGRCPCGSGKKYAHCCKPIIKRLHHDNTIDYPMESDFRNLNVDTIS